MRFLASITLAPLLISLITAAPQLNKRSFTGKATFYNAGGGACGGTNSNSDLIVALNKAQWGNPPNANASPLCGKAIVIHGPKGSVTAIITDMCPNCLYGDLDLTPAAFAMIGDSAQGVVPITWDFADAPSPSPSPPPPPPSPSTTYQQPTSTAVTPSITSSSPTPVPSNVAKRIYSFFNGNGL